MSYTHAQIASIFEFVGAVALGGTVTETVKGSITNPEMFKDQPQVCEGVRKCMRVHCARLFMP